MEVLTQDEIDQLLTAIDENGKPINREPFTIEKFEEYLLKRNTDYNEKPYGIFDRDITVCKYFDDIGGNESILSEIKLKNEKEGMGNVRIPNTDITLYNYSVCHNCKTIYSFTEINDYYMNPTPDQRFVSRSQQYRRDTRVCCSNCHTFFLPSLVISDGTPRNEVQYLCRTQTIDAVEIFYIRKNIRVLTKKDENIVRKGSQRAIKNDVYLKDLSEKPALITNMIQYTPFKYIMNLIDGTNVAKGDLLFDQWK